MFLSKAAVRRPVAVCCLIIALFLLGGNAYRQMSLELLPRMDVPYITVVTVYPGASPSDIEVDVAKRIEDAVGLVDGLKHVTSSCMENVVQTLLEFNLGVDVNVAANDVREKIDQELANFPSGVEKPVVMKYDVNAKPIATFALTGDLPLDDLYDYADNDLRDRLSVIPGVADVELIGGSEREVHVLLDRESLTAAGLSSLQVVGALQQGISTLPSGRIKEKGTEYGVRFNAEYGSVGEIGDLQVAGQNGARRYLGDLGEVVMASEERRQAAFIDGRPCIGIRIVKKSEANAVEVVNKVRSVLDTLKTRLPGGMDLVWVTDFGSYIQASVDSTTGNIVMGILLTALILFMFLMDIRSTFVVAISMPTTVVVSFFFMSLLDFSLNNSTLLAIGLSVGVLVTNSIVVLESVVLYFQNTKDPWEAANKGAGAVAVAVLASAGTNVVVLLPIGMMGSVVGLFFRPFAWTVLIVNVVSLFISFTLTPILCAVIIKKSKNQKPITARLNRMFNALQERLIWRYVAGLRSLSRRRWACALVLAATVVLPLPGAQDRFQFRSRAG